MLDAAGFFIPARRNPPRKNIPKYSAWAKPYAYGLP